MISKFQISELTTTPPKLIKIKVFELPETQNGLYLSQIGVNWFFTSWAYTRHHCGHFEPLITILWQKGARQSIFEYRNFKLDLWTNRLTEFDETWYNVSSLNSNQDSYVTPVREKNCDQWSMAKSKNFREAISRER